ncbi:helix-turn-helix domain-containing protein [Mucilaginibacter sp. X4EP1]|uniref:helix-turn-helix domain-containing protein n=1 Tax=Mucilaginibacter sp. X4EP1 TaxID=2723092 RepID=UPI002168B612|nr:AraC family transcriptional regulator [Mucilaginibacter sp. X4EP1]MCS3811559.1 AraC-like DNA-binding protein [Mucilaginibacter sp. X4EP1]
MNAVLNYPYDLLKTNTSFKFTGTGTYAIYQAPPKNSGDQHILQVSHCLEVVLSGHSDVTSGAHSQHVGQGELLFRKKGSYQLKYSPDYCGMLFFVDDEFIQEFVSDLKSYPQVKGNESSFHQFDVSPTSNYIVEQIKEKVLFQQQFSPCIIRNLLLSLFFQILSETVPKPFIGFLKSLLSDGRKDIPYLMESTYLQKFSLPELALLSGRSVTTFKKDFTEVMHTSPFRWILNRRLDHARHLIKASDRRVSEVAFQSGFDNMAHFSRAYHEKFGVTAAAEKKANALTER